MVLRLFAHSAEILMRLDLSEDSMTLTMVELEEKLNCVENSLDLEIQTSAGIHLAATRHNIVGVVVFEGEMKAVETLIFSWSLMSKNRGDVKTPSRFLGERMSCFWAVVRRVMSHRAKIWQCKLLHFQIKDP